MSTILPEGNRRFTRLAMSIVATLAAFGVAWVVGARTAQAAGEVCFATVNGTPVYSSTNANAVQQAVDGAGVTDTVKIAGYCAGVQSRGGTAQTVYISTGLTLTLRGGYTTTDWVNSYPLTRPTMLDARGGGRVISASAALVTLRGVTLTNGLVNAGATNQNGGGIYAAGRLVLQNVWVYSNTLIGTAGVQLGGGAYAATGLDVRDSVVYSNAVTGSGGTQQGGGIYADGAYAVAMAAIFRDNYARTSGGALVIDVSTKADVLNVLFARNRVGAGAGAGAGAALHVVTAYPFHIYHATFASPTLVSGAAVYVVTGTGEVMNSIVASHTVGIERSGGSVAQAYNVFFGNSDDLSGTVSGGPSALGDPAFYDTQQYTLTATSAAIDTGTDVSVPDDYFHNTRGAYPDAGYMESGVPVVARCSATPDNGGRVFKAMTAMAVQHAIEEAPAGGQVKVAGYCAGMVLYNGVTQVAFIAKPLMVQGGYTTTDWMNSFPLTRPTTLDALRLGRVISTNAAAPGVTLQGLVLINGQTDARGGGVYATGPLVMSQMTVTNNHVGFAWGQDFDDVTAPALPLGWSTTHSGYASDWTTVNSASSSAPNSAFDGAVSMPGDGMLTTPSFSVARFTQLTFRHQYTLQAGYDGVVLEIKIGAGAWQDILAAGGSYVSGGYNATLSSNYSNPLGGRQAWSGNSGGFYTTVVNLPLSTAWQTVQLRWRVGYDSSSSSPAPSLGYWLDSIVVQSSGEGGGVYASDALNVSRSAFVANTAGTGSALYAAGTAASQLVNVLVDRNQAAGAWAAGAALYVAGANPLNVTHATIVSPTVSGDAAICVMSGTVNITNSIVASHSVGILPAGGTATQTYNVFFGNSSNFSGTVLGGPSLMDDPAFYDSVAYTVTAASAVVDVGAPGTGVVIDYFGNPRPRGGGPDAGYAESSFAAVAQCYATPNSGTTVYSSTTALAVQRAVDAAAVNGTVKLAGTCAGVTLYDGAFQSVRVSKALTLAGGYTTSNWTTYNPAGLPTTLDALRQGQVISIPAAPVTLQGFTVTNGEGADRGGGIYAGGALTLSQMVVVNNRAGYEFSEDFDALTPPALPAGWSTGHTSTYVSNWTTVNTAASSSPNSAFAPPPSPLPFAGETVLTSTSFMAGPATTLTFRQQYNLENNYDGTALEIQIGAGGFQDIIAAGGSFVSGGYNSNLGYGGSNPLQWHAAWSGNSGGFITTVVNLPPAAAGQFVRLRWRTGYDASSGMSPSTGQWLDSILVTPLGYGGGVYAAGLLNISRTAFISNTAGRGSALYVQAGAGQVVNTLFDRNQAGGAGPVVGATVYAASANPLNLVHATIADPALAAGAAVHVAGGTVFITNSIIASHTAGIRQVGGVAMQGYNLFFGNASPLSGTVTSGRPSLAGDPAFYDTQQYTLTAASMAVDAGTNAGVSIDYFGNARPRGGGPDAGYAESPYATTPTCFATSNGGTTVFSSTTGAAVQRAVDAAAVNGTVRIAGTCAGVTLDGGAYQVALLSKPLTLSGGYSTSNWTTYNPASNPTTLDAQGLGRVISTTPATAVTLQGVTATNGLINAGVDDAAGGGIYAGGALTLTEVAVFSNTVTGSGGVQQGGGVYAAGALQVARTVFRSNFARSYGGGLYVAGVETQSPASLLVNVLFDRNRAGAGSGSAVVVDASAAGAGPLNIVHATVVSPTQVAGSAIYVLSGTVYVTNSIVASHTIGIERAGGAVAHACDVFFGDAINITGAVTGGPSLVGAPAFFDSVNYTPTAASAAVDVGANAGVTVDYFGNTRPRGGGPDVGYAESATSGDYVCFASANNGTTVYSSTTALAVQRAVDAAAANGIVKVAGYCDGVMAYGSTQQTVLITKALALAGGYTTTNWSSAFPLTRPTTLDALGWGRVISALAPVSLQGFTAINGQSEGSGGGIYAASALSMTGMMVQSNRAGNELNENFDMLAVLPSGWSTIRTGQMPTWGVVNDSYSSAPSSAHGPGGWPAGENQMISPSFVVGRFATLTFMNRYDLPAGHEGAVLEIKIGALDFQDILASGGSFVTGGYNGTLTTYEQNPLGGRQAWTGTSSGYLTTVVNLPLSAAGQTVQLRWRIGTDYNMGSGNGQWVDSVVVAPAGYGGGVYAAGTIDISRTAFVSNTASTGSAIYAGAGAAGRLVNVLFDRNQAQGVSTERAVVYVAASVGANPLNIVHATMVKPAVVAASGAAIYVLSGTVYVTNSIVASQSVGIQNAGGTVTQAYNVFYGNTTPITGTVSGTVVVSNPAFYDTAGYTLTVNSAAIDAGTNVGVTSDYFGNTRPQGRGMDMGYFEAPATYSLTVNKVGSGVVTPTGVLTYFTGTGVTVLANPATGWLFTGWSGACSGIGACVVMVTGTRQVTATFTQIMQFHVDRDAPGPAHDGLSWTTAFTGVQEALSAVPTGAEVWVAEGVYKPTAGTDRNASFGLRSGVALYGGFGGYGVSETLRAQRDWRAHVTVLSGDIDGNDRVDANGVVTSSTGISGSNSYNVVKAVGVTGTAVLDGFTVTGGNANGGGGCPGSGCGGGLLSYAQSGIASAPTLNRLVFSGNGTTYRGGGMFSQGGVAALSYVTFTGNSAVATGSTGNVGGGGLCADSSDLVLTNTLFAGNTAERGGGLMSISGTLILTDATFTGNASTNGTFYGGTYCNGGGGMCHYSGGSVALARVSFLSNTTGIDGGGLFIDSASAALSVVTFTGNTANMSGGGLYNTNTNLNLAQTSFNNNRTGANGDGGGVYYNQGNLAVTDASFTGNAGRTGGGLDVPNGIVTARAVTFTNNTATDSGGGMSMGNTNSVLTLSDAQFISNTAPAGGGLANGNASLRLSNVTFVRNMATISSTNGSGGGGLFNMGPAVITNVVFYGNRSGNDGGGVYNAYWGAMTITNALFVGNVVAQKGGGMYNMTYSPNAVRVVNATFANNVAAAGGAFHNWGQAGGTSDYTYLINDIMWDNTPSQVEYTFSVPQVSYSDVQGGYAGAGNINANPLFVTGPGAGADGAWGTADDVYGDLRLLAGSPAIDAGDDAWCPATDFADVVRPKNAHCDMGAYEALPQPVLGITKTVTPTSNVPYRGVVTYTVVLRNTGAVSETNGPMTDTLPASVTFGRWLAHPAGITRAGNAITWTGVVTAGDALTFTFTATHTGGYGDVMTNTARFSSTYQTGSASATFVVNHLPVISTIPNAMVWEDQPTSSIGFAVNDQETPAAALTLTAASGNTVLVPLGNIVFGGAGGNRTVVVTPALNQYGTAVITVTVWEGSASASSSFTLTVDALNDPPAMSPIPDVTVDEDTVAGPIPFTVSDVDTPVGALSVRADWGNWDLVPPDNVAIGGSGVTRTLTITPAPNQNGVAVMTVVVSDGYLEASRSFTLTVRPANDAPVANAGPDQRVNLSATVTLDGRGSSDLDGDVLTYGWAQTGGPAVSFARGVSVTMFTAPPDPAVLTFTLTVTDSQGVASAPDTVVVWVDPTLLDLGVTQSAIRVASDLTFTIVLNNNGPGDGKGAALTSTVMNGVVMGGTLCDIAVCPTVSRRPAEGIFMEITATLPALPAGAVVTYTLVVYAFDYRAGNTVAVAPPAGYTDMVAGNDIVTTMSGAQVMLPVVLAH
jgi:uncharacterized repeat protein (TIGR01451 family)